jgi:hypothetical protein
MKYNRVKTIYKSTFSKVQLDRESEINGLGGDVVVRDVFKTHDCRGNLALCE